MSTTSATETGKTLPFACGHCANDVSSWNCNDCLSLGKEGSAFVRPAKLCSFCHFAFHQGAGSWHKVTPIGMWPLDHDDLSMMLTSFLQYYPSCDRTRMRFLSVAGPFGYMLYMPEILLSRGNSPESLILETYLLFVSVMRLAMRASRSTFVTSSYPATQTNSKQFCNLIELTEKRPARHLNLPRWRQPAPLLVL